MVHYNLAYGLQLAGRRDEAQAQYQEAIRLDPHLAATRHESAALSLLRRTLLIGLAAVRPGHGRLLGQRPLGLVDRLGEPEPTPLITCWSGDFRTASSA